jgi:hypothetical protein
MCRCVLVRVGQLEHEAIAVGSTEGRNADGQAIRGEASRDGDQGDIDQKGIDGRSALLCDKGRIDTVGD